ncbi:MAG: vWA domain-containing protein [Vicinamibacterales bacterium]
MYPFASLPENLAAFCEALRRHHGFHIGPGELHDAARALEVVDLANERAVRHALRPILGGTLDDITVFDAAFAQFFFPGPAGVPQDELPSTRREPGTDTDGRDADLPPHAHHAPRFDTDVDDEPAARGGPMTFESTADRLEEAAIFAPSGYSPLDADASDAPELPHVEQAWRDAAQSFVRRLHLGLSRRWRPASRGRRFDLRRTLRAGLQTGGEALSPRWLRRPRRAPRIVLLIDGSRSMSANTRTALQMTVALATATMRVEVFTFSTRLQRITDEVRRAAAGESRRLDGLPHGWAGGTTIGVCLRDFLRRFGERIVGRDTVVIIASDGLDVGMPDVLREAMRELHRRSAGIVWLNPLLETEGYEPTAAGMTAARPSITTFACVNDQAGLARLSRFVRMRA